MRNRPDRVATTYVGPVATWNLVLGNRPLALVRPGEPDRMLDDPTVLAWNREDDYMPYWAYVWPGAYLLAEVVSAGSWPPGTRVLEIGCGLGLAGLTALRSGLDVTFSDYDEGAFGYVARSAEVNGFESGSYRCLRMDWRDPPSGGYALILGADVLYEGRLVPLVASLLDKLLEPGGLALIADPYRVSAEGFAAQVESRGLACAVEPVTAETRELGPVRGTIHRVSRPISCHQG